MFLVWNIIRPYKEGGDDTSICQDGQASKICKRNQIWFMDVAEI